MELRRFRLFEAKRDLREVGPQRRSYELVLESRGCIRGYVTGIMEVLEGRRGYMSTFRVEIEVI